MTNSIEDFFPESKSLARKRRSKKHLEGRVVRECLQFLKQDPRVIYVERRNTGAVRFQDGGFIRFGSKGAADIWALIKIPLYEVDISEDLTIPPVQPRLSGSYTVRHVEIEAKRSDGKGRQSPDQKKFQKFCDSHCIPYILTTSAIELEAKINEIYS